MRIFNAFRLAASTQAITDKTFLQRLGRTWDSALGGLTSVDYLAIARADPFYSNPVFNPNTDTTHRFDLPNSKDLIFNYIPVPPGGQATGETYVSSYNSTSMTGQSASTTFVVGSSTVGNLSATFLAQLAGKLNISSAYSYTNTASSTISNGTTQNLSFTIYPPLASDNYVGPTAMQVWKDNIYGTFMFYPEN